ncbi:MAG: ceramidase [Marinibacterium sp.]|nr:ceramidase [Marinibacterium sp.]
MDWHQQVNNYCERLGPDYWAEPINALTNVAFVIAALIMAWRLRGQRAPLAWVLVGILTAIGIGSFLFHTHATIWAMFADVLPILLFIVVYIFAVNRDVLGLQGWRAYGLTALFIPYAALTAPLFSQVPGLGSSASYAPVALLIAIYAVGLMWVLPQVARGLAIGAVLLGLSITFRSLDMPLCGGVPQGTHFLWHVLNGLMLGWMIEVYRRHLLTGRTARTAETLPRREPG